MTLRITFSWAVYLEFYERSRMLKNTNILNIFPKLQFWLPNFIQICDKINYLEKTVASMYICTCNTANLIGPVGHRPKDQYRFSTLCNVNAGPFQKHY